ncbi:acyl-CoA dehydrogenase [Denitratisoma sp. DHT3]|uniref:acyl-CoA dehydrogenase family protein n=1 Tax=Denitratisoma sp. DHT3 TaxID=1981880 RepID=UPI001198B89A|nr:acyl-CoA dehydrogenase family protein [Denitratisoma sp. DHT3]QDX80566.1 acyl-CoA dehydrogenase [Denitratisoma sp. DHT3]
MDFTFSEDQIAFREAMHSFFAKELPLEAIRKNWETEAGHAPELQARIAEQGLFGLSVPEDFGGLGLSDVDWVQMTQELGYSALPDYVVDTAYVAVGLLNALPAGHALAAEWLPRIAEGGARVAVGHPSQKLVADADSADLLLLSHQGELHAVAGSAVKTVLNPSIDLSRRPCRVEWTPGAETRVLDAAAAAPLWEDALNRGALAAAGQIMGQILRMLDISVAYTSERKQFGKPIGSFQAVKHHLATVAVKAEFAKPVLERAAQAMASGDPARGVHVSHAKLACGDAGWLAARSGIQVHGGMGYTWEVDLQIFMKRAWVLDAAWGDRAFHKNRVAAHVLSANALLGAGKTFI